MIMYTSSLPLLSDQLSNGEGKKSLLEENGIVKVLVFVVYCYRGICIKSSVFTNWTIILTYYITQMEEENGLYLLIKMVAFFEKGGAWCWCL
jgi:hypothetical protein